MHEFGLSLLHHFLLLNVQFDFLIVVVHYLNTSGLKALSFLFGRWIKVLVKVDFVWIRLLGFLLNLNRLLLLINICEFFVLRIQIINNNFSISDHIHHRFHPWGLLSFVNFWNILQIDLWNSCITFWWRFLFLFFRRWRLKRKALAAKFLYCFLHYYNLFCLFNLFDLLFLHLLFLLLFFFTLFLNPCLNLNFIFDSSSWFLFHFFLNESLQLSTILNIH